MIGKLRLWLNDHLNPILVKETRQALKSRQFVITFALLLLAAWVWTLMSVAWVGPEIWYGAKGRDVFFAYYLILAFPLLVIVPFGALRSLAGEHEERTYDLLSITSLGPRQIISGKLGSAALQMLIYLSAISPCLAFTYLLRGIDVLTILFILSYTVLASLGLAMLALVVGTLTSEKHWQVVLGVMAVAGLLFAFFCACGLTSGFLWSPGMLVNSSEFWIVCAGMLTAYLSYFALAYYAAAARLAFTASNRSTRLRVVMLVQQLLLTGWMSWVWLGGDKGRNGGEFFMVLLVLVALHWYAMGVFMTGESPELSPRVKRSLPQSFLGRAFLTWFNPGPATGYVFALAGFLGATLTAAACMVLVPSIAVWMSGEVGTNWSPIIANLTARAPLSATSAVGSKPWFQDYLYPLFIVSAGAFFYLTIYLGLGLLLLRFLRRFRWSGLLPTLLAHFVLVVVLVLVPLFLHALLTAGRVDNTLPFLEITSAPWTAIYVLDRGPRSMPLEAPALLAIVGVMAAGVFLLNLPGILREVRHVRIEQPRRVVEEDAALAPPVPVQTSPWG